MCTFIVSWQPGERWPLLLGANRDELITRAWRKPGRHWSDRPEVIAGQDIKAGGSWLGINDHGVIAGILNRTNSTALEICFIRSDCGNLYANNCLE